MSVFLDILHRATNRRRRDGDSTEENVNLTTGSLEPPSWLTERLELIVTIAVICLIVLFIIATQLPTDWTLKHRSHNSQTDEYEDVPETEAVVADSGTIEGNYTLEGTMSGVGDITMHLYIPSGSNDVTGSYSYNRYGQEITLRGDILRYDQPVTLNLYELNDYGDRVGRITGEFDGYTFDGKYVNFRSGREYPVTARVTN